MTASQVLSDELCEVLRGEREPTGVAAMLRQNAASVDGAIVDLARRGFLPDLLGDWAVTEDSELVSALCDTVATPEALFLLCQQLCHRDYAAAWEPLGELLLSAGDRLATVFEQLIDAGEYERLLEALNVKKYRDTEVLHRLAACRPTYDMAELNQPTLRRLSELSFSCPFDLLIVPGYTPVKTPKPTPLAELPAAQARVRLAAQDLEQGLAPAIFVSGGSVHPPGTPYNEALMMRQYLLELGVADYQILIDPHARHSTTNLRNAGRLLLKRPHRKGLIVTGFESEVFSQAFYFAHDTLSTFKLRCQKELGYSVGDLEPRDQHHIEFSPNPAVVRQTPFDPLDV